jgi:hypothetical protein
MTSEIDAFDEDDDEDESLSGLAESEQETQNNAECKPFTLTARIVIINSSIKHTSECFPCCGIAHSQGAQD